MCSCEDTVEQMYVLEKEITNALKQVLLIYVCHKNFQSTGFGEKNDHCIESDRGECMSS